MEGREFIKGYDHIEREIVTYKRKYCIFANAMNRKNLEDMTLEEL